MSYLGRTQLKASDIRKAGPTTASGGETYVDATWNAPNIQSLLFSINGVKQATDAYTISGTPTRLTLTGGATLLVGDIWEIIGINDIGTTITPADGTVNLAKMDAGTATSGYFLKTDGSNLSWAEVVIPPNPTVGDITTANNFFQNWNTIDTNTTSTFATTINAAIIGPITVTGSNVWTVSGILNIL
tara:strand:+ start:1348 stop:1908 length:561 start_codon:yes stop_codon:yes gene_type:complete